ncbi:MAG: hypothetical protein OEY31_14970 [Candidatus Bathyarchaeota archaeon]|nr:hypothetical protein [Candidatus Bathyarchaeota archaeon]
MENEEIVERGYDRTAKTYHGRRHTVSWLASGKVRMALYRASQKGHLSAAILTWLDSAFSSASL